jgi:hypothetical protein
MPRPHSVDDINRPNVYRVTYKAIAQILADKNPAEAQHRQWLQQRLAEVTRQISAIEAAIRRGEKPIPGTRPLMIITPAAPLSYDKCPHCDQSSPERYFYSDGDNLQLFHALAEAKRTPSAFHGVFSIGHCVKCEGDYFGATLTMLNRDTDDAVNDVLWLNTDTTQTGRYDAEHNGSRWTIETHDTPFGLMLKHDFGPFKRQPDYADFLRSMIIGMWDELRVLFNCSEFVMERPE